MKSSVVKMSKFLLLIMITLILIPAYIQAQQVNYRTIKGKIKDKESKDNIIFATVSVMNSNVGIVSNTEGEFIIKIKDSLNAKNLEFAHIGYKSKIVPINSLKEKGNTIYLDPVSVSLDEITVRPLSAEEIIRAALQLKEKNYSTVPLNFTAFYRETVQKRKDYISISEAVVDIYKAPYNKPFEKDLVKIYKGRKGSNVKRADTVMVKLIGGPYIPLLLDVVKNPYTLIDLAYINDYKFKMENVMSISNRLNYVISFEPRIENDEVPIFSGKYYIDVKSLAITTVEFSLENKNREKASEFFVKKKPAGMKLIPVNAKYIAKYKKTGGKFFFNYARGEIEFKCKWPKKLFNTYYTITSEMATTDRTAINVTKFNRKEVLKKNTVFAEELAAFNDDDFWGEFNFIEPGVSLENAMKKYKRKYKRQNK
ncbi:MAG: carboxypeptidase-like regulatory domain-containing protein [Bacteroidales bacterium]|nr:carboxypeptidase-like regulatory domain-containing protein [Bacteroidales bacterium]